MTCRELVEFVMAYLDKELPASQRAEFERHLTVCPSCVNYLETYRTTIEVSKAACCGGADAPVPASVPKDLVEAILRARKA
ncbi:MAG: anti-sigma factor family protein [Phycisphaerales bacterium]